MKGSRWRRAVALWGAVAIVGIAALGVGVAPSAQAVVAGALTITNQATGAPSGDNFAQLAFTTPAVCGPSATRHVTKVTAVTAANPAEQATMDGWVGRNFYSPLALGLPGPFDAYPANNNLQGLANTFGLPLITGTYEVTFRCQSSLGTIIYEEFVGQLVFDSPTAWHAVNPAAKIATTTTITATPSPATTSDLVTLSAQVTPAAGFSGDITGEVEFLNGTTVLGQVAVSAAGVATLSQTFAVGDASLTARYLGTSGLLESSGSTTLTVNPVDPTDVPTTTTLSANPTSVLEGETVTLQVAVAAQGGAAVTGSVEIREGSIVLDTVALTAGAGSWTTSAWPVGDHAVTARYLGVTGFSTSESAPVTVTVRAAPKATTTALAVSSADVVVGQTVTLSATVTPTATGSVEFRDGATLLASAVALSGSIATLDVSTLEVGSHEITATYLGVDGAFLTSTSTARTVTVSSASALDSSTELAVTPTAPAAGSPVTLTATVTVVAPSGGQAFRAAMASGQVEFFDGTASLGSATLASGVASVTTSDLSVGTHTLTARYAGSGTAKVSTSAAVTVTVLAASATATPTTSTPGSTTPGGVVVSVPGLANTGAEVGGLLSLALALLGSGCAVLVCLRRGRSVAGRHRAGAAAQANGRMT